jgi:hypothetical protein
MYVVAGTTEHDLAGVVGCLEAPWPTLRGIHPSAANSLDGLVGS